MRFGPWHPIARAPELAPDRPGVLQARADALRELPRGRSAMVLYGSSAADESLRAFLVGRGAPLLAAATDLGASWIRFAEASAPEAQLARLLQNFEERFGAPPRGNARDPGAR